MCAASRKDIPGVGLTEQRSSHVRPRPRGDHCAHDLQPVAHPAGGARDPLEHRPGVCVLRLQAPPGRALRDGRGRRCRDRLDLLAGHRDAGHLVRDRRHMGGARGPAEVDGRRGLVLGRGLLRLHDRHRVRPAVARLSGLWSDRRHRPGHRLHLARLDPHEMVPRPARAGDRPRHHGLRRRRAHREPRVERAHGVLRRRSRQSR